MKKPLSDMSAHEFVEHVGALGLRYADMASKLNKSQPAISRYANGHQRIPQEVADQLRELINAKAAELKARGESIKTADVVSSLIVYHNTTRKRPERHHTQGRFMRRQGEQDTRTYPVYRMSRERYVLYVRALASWRERVIELAREHTDERRQSDYRLELADIKAMADCAPRQAPYDVCIQRNEWMVVSRALTHLAKSTKAGDPTTSRAADSLRSHWLNHRGSGYPKHRHTVAPST